MFVNFLLRQVLNIFYLEEPAKVFIGHGYFFGDNNGMLEIEGKLRVHDKKENLQYHPSIYIGLFAYSLLLMSK